jgi:hypothetical protein
LITDVAIDHFHGLRQQRDLSGQVNRVAGPHGLGIGANGFRGLVGTDDLTAHFFLHFMTDHSEQITVNRLQ